MEVALTTLIQLSSTISECAATHCGITFTAHRDRAEDFKTLLVAYADLCWKKCLTFVECAS